MIGRITIDRDRDWMLPEEEQLAVSGNHIWLKMEVHGVSGKFFCSEDGTNYTQVGEAFDASILSDDYAYGFTGAMVGKACQDLQFHRHPADFKSFTYKEL